MFLKDLNVFIDHDRFLHAVMVIKSFSLSLRWLLKSFQLTTWARPIPCTHSHSAKQETTVLSYSFCLGFPDLLFNSLWRYTAASLASWKNNQTKERKKKWVCLGEEEARGVNRVLKCPLDYVLTKDWTPCCCNFPASEFPVSWNLATCYTPTHTQGHLVPAAHHDATAEWPASPRGIWLIKTSFHQIPGNIIHTLFYHITWKSP